MKDGWTLILGAIGIVALIPILAFGGGGDSGPGLFDARPGTLDLSALPDRVFAPDEPEQHNLSNGPRFDRAGIALTAVARYRIQGLVLARKAYRRDWASAISPLDLGIGWGALSNPRVVAQMTFTPGPRRMYYRGSDGGGMSTTEMTRSLANTHLIPAGEAQRAALEQVGVGDVVLIEGYLVNALGPDGTRWRTSRSRIDTGLTGCEIIFVQTVRSYTPDARMYAPAQPPGG